MREAVRQIVGHEGAIKAGAILDRLEEVDATAILQLIDTEIVFAALDGIFAIRYQRSLDCGLTRGGEHSTGDGSTSLVSF